MTIQESGKLLSLLSELKKRNNQLFGLAALYDGNIKQILLSINSANELIYKAMYRVLDDSLPAMVNPAPAAASPQRRIQA